MLTKPRFPNLSEFHAILKIGLPAAMGILAELIIGITDNIMVGHLGTDELAAVGLASSVYKIILMISWGMLFPTIVLVSQARGTVDQLQAVQKIIRQGLWVCGILFVPGGAVLWHLEEILLLTGQFPELARMAENYMNYQLWTLFPVLTSTVFMLAFTAMGRATTSATIMWCAVGLNAVLDYALIFGKFGLPAMGVAGAGLASVIVHGMVHMAFFIHLAFHRFFRRATLFRHAWRPKPATLEQFFRLGWPKALEMVMKHSLFSVITLLAGRFGAQSAAAHTIAFQIAVVVGVAVPVATASAVATRMGMARGQGKLANMQLILNSGISLLLLFIIPAIMMLKVFSPWIVMLFVSAEAKNQDLVLLASPLIVLVAFFVLADSLRLVVTYALNSLSDMKVPSLILGLAYWGISLPVGVVLGFTMELGILGLWWGLVFGIAVAAITHLIRFRWLVRHSLVTAVKSV